MSVVYCFVISGASSHHIVGPIAIIIFGSIIVLLVATVLPIINTISTCAAQKIKNIHMLIWHCQLLEYSPIFEVPGVAKVTAEYSANCCRLLVREPAIFSPIMCAPANKGLATRRRRHFYNALPVSLWSPLLLLCVTVAVDLGTHVDWIGYCNSAVSLAATMKIWRPWAQMAWAPLEMLLLYLLTGLNFFSVFFHDLIGIHRKQKRFGFSVLFADSSRLRRCCSTTLKMKQSRAIKAYLTHWW